MLPVPLLLPGTKMFERMSQEEFDARMDAGEDPYSIVGDDLRRQGYIFDGEKYVSPAETALDRLRPGAIWVNKHTGDATKIKTFASRIERLPNATGGFKDDPQLVVHHTCNAPPGFKQGYGDDLDTFLEHWRPAALASTGDTEAGKK